MKLNWFYLKLVGFLLVGYVLVHGTYVIYVTWQSMSESSLSGWLWLTGMPQMVLISLVLAVGAIFIYLASLANWLIGHHIGEKLNREAAKDDQASKASYKNFDLEDDITKNQNDIN